MAGCAKPATGCEVYVAVEGVIGAGKTSLARAIGKRLGWRVLEEPVDGNKLLPLFYEDPKKWAFPFQIKMLHSRYASQNEAAYSRQMCVLDRSLPGDRVFAWLHRLYGNMHAVEWEVYEECYRVMSAIRPPALLLYLRVSPEVAEARMKKRARTVESGVPLAYLRDLATHYDELINTIEGGRHAWSRGLRVQRLDWDADLSEESYERAVDMLLPALLEAAADHG